MIEQHNQLGWIMDNFWGSRVELWWAKARLLGISRDGFQSVLRWLSKGDAVNSLIVSWCSTTQRSQTGAAHCPRFASCAF